jgi:hypothetical protein
MQHQKIHKKPQNIQNRPAQGNTLATFCHQDPSQDLGDHHHAPEPTTPVKGITILFSPTIFHMAVPLHLTHRRSAIPCPSENSRWMETMLVADHEARDRMAKSIGCGMTEI